MGDLAGADEQHRLARAALDALPTASRQDRARQREETRLDQGIGFLASLCGHPQEALACYRRNAAVHQAWIDADPADVTARRALMDSQEWVAIVLRECGEPGPALAEHRRALALCQAALEADPTNIQARNDAADVLHEIGNTLLVLGDATGALASYRQALGHYGALVAADSINVHARRQRCLVQEEMADALEAQGNTSEAPALRQQDLASLVQLTMLDPPNVEFQHDLALCLYHLGTLRAQTPGSNATPAKADFEKAAAILENLVKVSPLDAQARADLARVNASLEK